MGLRAFSAGAAASLLLMACVPGLAEEPQASSQQQSSSQVPRPVTGFVSPYEIMRTVRAAGFDPLAPPLREGTTYVLRATDFRGILMRVVVDARSGAIRDANRIVPGSGSYGQAEFGPYGAPASYSASAYGEPAPPPAEPDTAHAPVIGRAAAHARVVISPPLPRPRPAAIAKTDSKAELKPAEAAAPAAPGKPAPIND